jgi:heme-degrading monooxygenase HmoA
MHGRIATARVRPGSAAEVEAAWRGLLAPYRRTGAFVGMVALLAADDRAVTLTLWSSDEAADAAAAELRPLAAEAFGDLALEAPVIEAYEVLLCEGVPGSPGGA